MGYSPVPLGHLPFCLATSNVFWMALCFLLHLPCASHVLGAVSSISGQLPWFLAPTFLVFLFVDRGRGFHPHIYLGVCSPLSLWATSQVLGADLLLAPSQGLCFWCNVNHRSMNIKPGKKRAPPVKKPPDTRQVSNPRPPCLGRPQMPARPPPPPTNVGWPKILSGGP